MTAEGSPFSTGAKGSIFNALNQTLNVTEGAGLVQSRGADIVNIRSGDVIYMPPDEWHWHGAAPDHLMTHHSIIEGVAEGQGTDTCEEEPAVSMSTGDVAECNVDCWRSRSCLVSPSSPKRASM